MGRVTAERAAEVQGPLQERQDRRKAELDASQQDVQSLWGTRMWGPLLEKFCPLFKYFAHLGSRLPRLLFNLPTFKLRPGKGVLG